MSDYLEIITNNDNNVAEILNSWTKNTEWIKSAKINECYQNELYINGRSGITYLKGKHKNYFLALLSELQQVCDINLVKLRGNKEIREKLDI